jgi:hypothetical protein
LSQISGNSDHNIDPQFLEKELIWHGEIEARLDSCNPLLCVAIYDSCRDNPPEVIADIVKNTRSVELCCYRFLISFHVQSLATSKIDNLF